MAVKLVSTRGMSPDDWLKYRKVGIGASEVGVVMNLSPYKSPIQLFYEKIGLVSDYNIENLSMFLGKELEPLLAKMWTFWENDQATMLQNFRSGKMVRKCRQVNAYAHNDKFPWLFASLDRMINKNGMHPRGSLELKTISGYEADKWESSFPPSYVTQVQTQLLVMEFLYGESAILRDNREFFVLPFDYSKSICESIIEITHKFWKKIEKARILVNKKFESERTYNFRQANEIQAELENLEPSPDGSDAFMSFLKDKFKLAEPGIKQGTPEELAAALQAKKVGDDIKSLEEKKRLKESILMQIMRDKYEKIEFPGNGFVSWKVDANGNRRFLNKVSE